MRHTTMLVAILAFTPLTDTTAQMSIRSGARVRVTGHFCQPPYTNCGEGWAERVGTFVAWKSDTLVVQSNGDTLSVPVDRVTRLDVSRGRKTNTGMGAGIGLLVGGVVGAIIGYANYEEGGFGDAGPGVYVAASGVFGGLGGVVVGALIGSEIETDRWREVPLDRLRVNLGPQRDGRFGVGMSLRF